MLVSTPDHDVGQATEVGQQALKYLQKVIALDPEHLECYKECSGILIIMGKLGEAMHLAERAFDIQRSLAERHQVDQLGIRFISPGMMTAIGAMSHLDAYIKAEAFGLRPSGRPILLVKPGQSIHNPHYPVSYTHLTLPTILLV